VGTASSELVRYLSSTVLVAVTFLIIGSAQSARGANAAPFVVHATANSQQLGAFNITRTPTLQGAITAFGKPDDCTLRSWFALAVWRSAGFRLRITTLGGLPTGETFCTAPHEVKIDSVIVTGKRWHTRRGLFIGDSLAKFHRLYPTARRFRSGWALRASTSDASLEFVRLPMCGSRD
jgi:hypothetical protein